ncbi:MAG: ABC-ATPase domain-containing protein [Gemmatimonadota bacterium]|nr:ABC-ATPase domain-containing protein [Gemmatimonadota bacterium]MDH5759484.1 ABC-ATPase domain-containing protein [Gemmatimonadota bacterium]
MRDSHDLAEALVRLDGRGYKAYKDVAGGWDFGDFVLHFDHVQGDPYAAPSRVRVLLPADTARLLPDAVTPPARALGTAAFLARSFAARARRTPGVDGTGPAGEIRMESPGQQVLPQTAVMVHPDGTVEARFTVSLPAQGRRILGRAAARVVTDTLPRMVRETLPGTAHDAGDLALHADVNEDAEALRQELDTLGLVAFVADGARLPRRSGVDDRPLEGEAVPFASPPSLRVSVELPNAGRITGMGVPRGITLIVGGGFHGKSTLLRALETGVYNHRPGDGRERVATRSDAVKVRAEDGRAVTAVDISGFIDDLPLERDTTRFSTADASGSTSQAAAIVEALEAGAGVLLADEDTSATNFMIRDRRMQELVPKSGEPITPFIDRARELADHHGVSIVLVLGGSGDYLDIADTVVVMNAYLPAEITEEARAVANRLPTGRMAERPRPFVPGAPRHPVRASLDPSRGHRAESIKVPDDRTILYGDARIDLTALEQVVHRGQIRALGNAMAHCHARLLSGDPPLTLLLDTVDGILRAGGLDAIQTRLTGDLVAFRRFELAAAINRLRSLAVHAGSPGGSRE